ncbi:tRNA (5-methylaminomethyl-2-thiouridine)(34)-methyltransferase MnmD [Flavihumibacter petaseus]|uniref:MnmC-like methyltransferase domain-containing protein n=1 Tax=Flavihumibacter petaseus NBRC 106054 TaxID=1220578 RepID=A0A0E9MWQ1_9BACT|nr:tRNA (5-methylaminomethyl-2-thiouridine)(34)-methyltransferase MnmD [Flavihumibacter petaseus]GAO42009.1 hypothetical protein FPE01S_01_10220 [Flavihumibacter petaseus NBRC 106054]
MERILQVTGDGSPTVAVPSLQVSYHSRHGAIQESMHVFIHAGLDPVLQQTTGTISILEMGFGTGLNALLTAIAAPDRMISYEACEKFPLEDDLVRSLNYCQLLERNDMETLFLQLHQSPWEKPVAITPRFTLVKHQVALENFAPQQVFNLIYFDAFAPAAQPELWTTAIFSKLYASLEEEGILVTYCSKGDVRRAMTAAGFTVEKLKGPPGKREMVKAVKQTRTTNNI